MKITKNNIIVGTLGIATGVAGASVVVKLAEGANRKHIKELRGVVKTMKKTIDGIEVKNSLLDNQVENSINDVKELRRESFDTMQKMIDLSNEMISLSNELLQQNRQIMETLEEETSATDELINDFSEKIQSINEIKSKKKEVCNTVKDMKKFAKTEFQKEPVVIKTDKTGEKEIAITANESSNKEQKPVGKKNNKKKHRKGERDQWKKN